MRKTWQRVVHITGANAYAILASAINLMVTARYFGPEGRGVLAAANSWVLLLSTFGSLSLGPVVIHLVSGKPRDSWLSETVGTVLAITLAVSLIGWSVVLIAYLRAAGALFNHLTPGLLIVAFAALPFLISNENGRYILYALDAVHIYNWALIIGSSLSIVSIVIMVIVLKSGLTGALWTVAISSCATTMVICFYLMRRSTGIRASRQLAGKLLSGGLQLHANVIGNLFFSQASVLVLNHFRPPHEIGFYQLATQLFNLAMVIPTSIGTAAYQLVATLGPDNAWPEQRRLLAQALLIVAAIGLCGYALAPQAVTIIAGKNFLAAVPLFRILLTGLIGATLSAVMASQWIGRGLFWQTSLLTLLVGLLTLACSFVLIPAYGMYGAVATFLLPHGISVCGNSLMAAWVDRRCRRKREAF